MIETIAPAPAEINSVMSVAENCCPATPIAIGLVGTNDIFIDDVFF
jgi:hypothetical protein